MDETVCQQVLVKETSDRGKYNLVRVDWTDPLQLKNLLYKRLTLNAPSGVIATEIWDAVIPKNNTQERMFQVMLDHCLMRPRFLIDLCERAISIAINRGNKTVLVDDMNHALKQHSNYLVSDFIYEIRDISSVDENIFYVFLGKGELFTKSELQTLFAASKTSLSHEAILDLLLWFGFIGLAKSDQERIYIYSVDYDQKRLEAMAENMGSDVFYCINPAFLEGLN